MKKLVLSGIVLFMVATLFSSCYVYTSSVGQGAQGTQEEKQWNNYFIYGLVPANVKDSKAMAGDAKDYDIIVKHSFVNGLIAAVTFGIYTPTTTIVKK
jgi:hypothetical protein